MNRRIAAVAAATTVLAGLVALVVPQHAAGAARVAAATVAVVAGALVLGAVGTVVGRDLSSSALDVVPAPGAPPLDPHGLRDARRDLVRPCAAGSVPIAVWERLVAAAPTAGRRRLDHKVLRLLHTRPQPGSCRDAQSVARVVHLTLDAFDAARDPSGAPRLGNR